MLDLENRYLKTHRSKQHYKTIHPAISAEDRKRKMKIGMMDSKFLCCSTVSEGRFHSRSPSEGTQSYVSPSASVFPLSV